MVSPVSPWRWHLAQMLLKTSKPFAGFAGLLDERHVLVEHFLAIGAGQPSAASQQNAGAIGELLVGVIRQLLRLIEAEVAGGDRALVDGVQQGHGPLGTAEQNGDGLLAELRRQLVPALDEDAAPVRRRSP